MLIAFIGLFSSFWFYKCDCYRYCVQKTKQNKTPDKECLQREIKTLYVTMYLLFTPSPLLFCSCSLSLAYTHTYTHTHTHSCMCTLKRRNSVPILTLVGTKRKDKHLIDWCKAYSRPKTNTTKTHQNKTKTHTGWLDYNACTSPQHDVQIVQVPTDAWGVLPEPPARCVGGGARGQTYEAAHTRDLGDPGVPQRQQGPDLAGLAGWASVVHHSTWCLIIHSLQHVLKLMPLRRFVRTSKLFVQWRVEDQVYGF